MKMRLLSISTLLVIVACGGPAKKDDVAGKVDQNQLFSQYRAYDHFVKGDLYEQAGDYNSAADEYRKALIFDPASAEIRRSLSDVYFRQRKFTESAVVRSEIPDRTIDDYNFIGDCLRFANDFAGAADFYKRSLKLDQTQLIIRKYLAGILYHLGDSKAAERHYKKAVDYSAEKIEAYMELASFYIRISENEKAQKAYAKALGENPDDLRPLIGSAALYVSDGDTVKADSIFNSLIDDNWEDPHFLGSLLPAFFSSERIELATKTSGRIAELLPDDIDALNRYAYLLFGSARYEEAESVFVAMEEKGTANEVILYYHGRIKQFNAEFAEAEVFYHRALAVNDTLTDAWINLGLVTDAQDDYKGALNIMQNAYEKIPWDTTTIVYYTSVIHSRNEEFELARDGYSRLLASYPENIDFRFNLGASYERLGEFEKAETEFKLILEKTPENALVLNYLGYMYADRGIKLKKALKMIKLAISRDPENGAFLDSYAWVLYKLGRYDDALVQMKKALDSDRSDPILFDHHGDILAALENTENARESWEKALELDPENQGIKAKLDGR
ncbi:MAG: tetratricopeptide repeat protein [candidate division Zixibacteria bacterium]